MPNWKPIGKYQKYIFWFNQGFLPSEVDEQDSEIMDEIAVYLSARNTVEEKHRTRK